MSALLLEFRDFRGNSFNYERVKKIIFWNLIRANNEGRRLREALVECGTPRF